MRAIALVWVLFSRRLCCSPMQFKANGNENKKAIASQGAIAFKYH
jgi:hypothetical protein